MRNRPTWAVLLVATALGGCASLHNPVPDAIPVRRLPDEVLRAPAACAPGCDATVRVQKPADAGRAKEIVRIGHEQSDAPPGPVPDPIPAVVDAGPAYGLPATCAAPAGCAPCAVYYTGGGLPSGAYPLRPDMRVTEAVAAAHGPLGSGCGCHAPTRVTVLRRLCTGQQLSIRVDLNEALRDPRENIPVWPNDKILTHETGCQAAGRVFGQLFRVGVRMPTRMLTGSAVP